jgi:uncharacterized protein YbbK (DUF523 family)
MMLVSACLADVRRRHDGGHNRFDPVVERVRSGRALPVCPEQLGALPTPRAPAEIRDGRGWPLSGTDVTAAFRRGAEEAFRLGRIAGCRRAIRKALSPLLRRGVGLRRHLFPRPRAPGDGFLAAMPREAGVEIATEEDPFD